MGGTPPDNWLVPSILATIFCCWPFGIPGILAAAKVMELWNVGDHAGAYEQSAKAKKFTLIALFAAIGVWVLIIVFYFVIFAAAMSSVGTYETTYDY
ncbi:CD225/dispanin family protein [Allosalinactinospora lopnorensis]|uniref:CD225/dispanin family protein n=1 Tax=Allosalinactinospora lopnorensis TaxID=1352348 RepID=UPI001F18986A|nr:CD225/dispanin family protein [Allosalinactinospora lopnorensis]